MSNRSTSVMTVVPPGLGERVAGDASGRFAVRVPAQQQTFRERQSLSPSLAQRHVQVDMEHALKAALPSLTTMLVPSACGPDARAPQGVRWPSFIITRDDVRWGVGQVGVVVVFPG